ncbi:hypothetical protein [Ulvibacter litoralis]|uniref:Uncharacterized protein n=2 Tax=Ulvibacter litoralis TaxID=227084 RepID=A0A1G7JS78_9FLAO|nr:hypothetical protein [Ulvibacter litoralis]GHC66192.1 hypothetical protein GCM10008083_34020 [Ulvibacter litoralis]SDF27808.1 hypothetical protein SAMN05421855_1272 [Ulvibacter litoralis]
MYFKIFVLIFLITLTIGCKSQTNDIENRTIDYYFEEVADLELKALLENKILIDSITVAEKYIDTLTNQINNEGFQKYAELKADIYMSYFRDYLYLQKVEYRNDIYVLYFSMAGFDDMEWNIMKWSKENWNAEERLNREELEKNNDVEKILWNYDEADKNTENIRVFIKNDYLVMERGNLYHSLYDLKNKKVILNEESPWNASGSKDGEEMNAWIKENLHDKIEQYLNTKRG